MKQCRRTVLKTTVLGKRGNSVIHSLLVNKYRKLSHGQASNAASQRSQALPRSNLVTAQEPDQIINDLNEEETRAKSRKIRTLTNWEKVREALLVFLSD